MLKINKLNINIADKNIIKDLDLAINDGEIHAIMGPNGVGKSSICKVIMGSSEYKIDGSITYNNIDLTALDITKRARLGIYEIAQNPVEIKGVTNALMLRTVLTECYQDKTNILEFNKKLEKLCNDLELPTSFIHRDINVGASGGERKKIETLHMWMLKPSLIILDELDSGLDVDAIKVVAKSINKYYQEYKPSILIITHHTNILEYLKPDYVHVLMNGNIVKTGSYDLAKYIEDNGYNQASIMKEET